MTEPILVLVTRYRCPHCAHSRARRSTSVAHINRCWHNPANRTCKTCIHLQDVPDGLPCFPDRPCNCNAGWIQCLAGLDLPEGLAFPAAACPRWHGESGIGPDQHVAASPESRESDLRRNGRNCT